MRAPTPPIKMLAALSFLLNVSAAIGATTFHVATNGDDAADGSINHPFATIDHARDCVRAAIHDQSPREAIQVLVHGGTYRQSKTLELGQQDSGTAECPVVWAAAPNESVRITGGPALPADAFSPVTDSAILARITETARGHVLQLNLRPFVDSAPAPYPDTFRGVPAAPELFFNDQRMTTARWPNRGWATIAKIIEPGSVPREGDTSSRSGVFEYGDAQPSHWNAQAGVWLQGYWCYDWYDQTIRIKSIDVARKQITLAAPAMYGVKQGNPSPRRFRALNVLEELDEPGEFYIDPAASTLYFWPPAPLPGARIALSTLNAPIVRCTDTQYLKLREMTFEATLGTAVDISGGCAVHIENCTIRNTRELGIRVIGGTKHRVDHCSITDTGTGGLILQGGDRKTLTPAGHEAVNNHIWNFSRHQLTGAYAIVVGGVGNRAAHNDIHDAPHQAVLIDGNDHVFELNYVHNVVTETDDAGAVYKGRNPSCRGNIIRNNFFADIGSPMGHGTAAIYFDDGDGGDLVFGNIFVRCGHPGQGSFGTVFSHGGSGIRAENNIFVDCKRPLGSAPWDDARWKDAIEGGQDCHFTEKLLHEVDITKPPYTTRYPELVGFMHPQPGQPRNNFASNNVIVRAAEVSSGNWIAPGAEMWVTSDDPGFINLAGENFQLRPDSEVFKRLPAFKMIPFDQVGPKDKP